MPLLMCPNCNTSMQEVRRNDVQIDMCPQCRGVWLDRGELEKLLSAAREVEAEYEREREAWARTPPPQSGHYQPPPQGGHYQPPPQSGHHQGYDRPYRKKKKSMFEMFDIFD